MLFRLPQKSRVSNSVQVVRSAQTISCHRLPFVFVDERRRPDGQQERFVPVPCLFQRLFGLTWPGSTRNTLLKNSEVSEGLKPRPSAVVKATNRCRHNDLLVSIYVRAVPQFVIVVIDFAFVREN